MIVVDENDVGKRLDLLVLEFFSEISRSKVQNAIKNGEITVNSSVKKPSYALKEGDKVEVNLKIGRAHV